ncbi:hypothetical protein DFP72DRAFT_942272 [Ephemerocybe angulata]|uniref:Uncharacterized protein n=1 Tax=Ephemerocybe angulata TaxID=980116 RepID=A0A8H6LS36_9AGAR|nr:hypothetical protein DFP72DRAFT_942272 [Tulosesus angulatus]
MHRHQPQSSAPPPTIPPFLLRFILIHRRQTPSPTPRAIQLAPRIRPRIHNRTRTPIIPKLICIPSPPHILIPIHLPIIIISIVLHAIIIIQPTLALLLRLRIPKESPTQLARMPTLALATSLSTMPTPRRVLDPVPHGPRRRPHRRIKRRLPIARATPRAAHRTR